MQLTPRRLKLALAALGVAVIGTSGVLLLNVTQKQNPGGVQGISAVVCDGSDVTSQLRSAVSGGGTVTLSSGTCALSGNIPIRTAVTVNGAGATMTHLIQHAASNIFQITGDGVTIENLDMNTATFHPGVPPVKKSPVSATLFSTGNGTTLLNVDSEAGTGFGMRFTGPSPCSSYQRSGLTLTNVNSTNTGQGGFTALDVDCHNGAILNQITITGDYIAFFQDENVILAGEQYTPGSKSCQFAVYVTAPSHNIAIDSVSGGGGVKQAGSPLTNITTSNISKASGC